MKISSRRVRKKLKKKSSDLLRLKKIIAIYSQNIFKIVLNFSNTIWKPISIFKNNIIFFKKEKNADAETKFQPLHPQHQRFTLRKGIFEAAKGW